MVILISALYIIFPFLLFPLIVLLFLLEKKPNHKKVYATLIAISFAILMYYFIPDPTKDLYRYYIIMSKLSILSIADFMTFLSTRVEPISNIYFYFFSKIGNYQLIMLFTTLISYAMIFYVLFDHQKKTSLSNQDFNIVCFFMFSVFFLVDDITGIRFCLARLIFFLAIYLDIYKENKSVYVKLLYVISPLIHSSCLIFVALRVFLKIIKNNFNFKSFLILTFISFSPTFLINFAGLFSNLSYFSSLSSKAEEYLSLNAGFYLMFILQIIIMIFIIIILIYSKRHCNLANNKYISFVLIIFSIALIFVNSSSISTRFIRAGIIFSLPVLMDFLKTLKPKNKLLFYFPLIIISFISLLFQYSHLTVDISYGDLFENGIFKNIISLLFKLMGGI